MFQVKSDNTKPTIHMTTNESNNISKTPDYYSMEEREE
jgi:hypothetical protein